MRTTKRDIYQIERVINGMLKRANTGKAITVQWAYDQPRAYIGPAGSDCVDRELSPRLPMGELYRWLDAFATGLQMGLEANHEG